MTSIWIQPTVRPCLDPLNVLSLGHLSCCQGIFRSGKHNASKLPAQPVLSELTHALQRSNSDDGLALCTVNTIWHFCMKLGKLCTCGSSSVERLSLILPRLFNICSSIQKSLHSCKVGCRSGQAQSSSSCTDLRYQNCGSF